MAKSNMKVHDLNESFQLFKKLHDSGTKDSGGERMQKKNMRVEHYHNISRQSKENSAQPHVVLSLSIISLTCTPENTHTCALSWCKF